MDGGGGDDLLEGDAGADIVTFEDAPVPVTVDLTLGTATGWGADSLSGIEAIVGSSFDDALTGDAQDNAFAAGTGDDAIDGRGGTDQAAYFDAAGSVVADLRAGVTTGWGTDTLLGVEDLTGSGSADTLTGDDGPNAIVAAAVPTCSPAPRATTSWSARRATTRSTAGTGSTRATPRPSWHARSIRCPLALGSEGG